ncbi:MAG: ATP-dependent DNA helicase PcrA, partial [Lachnospiraceae bacterium]|nr:ATP-dependent DNA helicase PcrA [Lachnospiraceae bacterium]
PVRTLPKEKLSDTVFDKPKKNNWEAAVNNSPSAGSTEGRTRQVSGVKPVSTSRPVNNQKPVSAPKKDISAIMTSRPKAVIKKKETPAENKPYIAKSLDGLTKGMPLLDSGGPGYEVGDRVSHIKYGNGTVLNIVQDVRDYKVTVNFDVAGNKIMYAAFAKLKKL